MPFGDSLGLRNQRLISIEHGDRHPVFLDELTCASEKRSQPTMPRHENLGRHEVEKGI